MHSRRVRTAPASFASLVNLSSTVELRRDRVDFAVGFGIPS